MTSSEEKLSRHEFLAELHMLLEPVTYLEVGVQYGHSLQLSRRSKKAIGIDPHPQVHARGNQEIFSMTADDYFTYIADPELVIDLAFIDGSHLFEDALRDFINIEQHSHPGTVVVFDDMLPYNDDVGGRAMVPGHWAGDVWKLHPILQWVRATDGGLKFLLVDTEPTGTMVVWDLNRANHDLAMAYPTICTAYEELTRVPQETVERSHAVPPAHALTVLTAWQTEQVAA